MKKYDDPWWTPLIFHNIFRWVLLPLCFIGLLFEIIDYFMDMDYSAAYGVFYVIDIVYYLSILGLTAACFIGFFQWKSYAWYCVITLLSVTVVYRAYVAVLFDVWGMYQRTAAVNDFIGSLIFSVLVGIYYIKRRPLFFPKKREVNAAAGGSGRTAQASKAGTADLPPGEKFCSWCGAALSEGSDICSVCGTPVQRR